MTARSTLQTTIAVTGGALAGALGGIVLSLYTLLAILSGHADPWIAFKLAAAPLYGDRVIAPGFEVGPVLLGVTAHFAISVVWGVLFGVLAFGLSRMATVFAGLACGLCAWIVMIYLVLPTTGLAEVTAGSSTAGTILAHLVFGATLAIGFMPFQRYTGPLRRPHAHR
jgi:hypothetical protein